jgi:hypothetical protein
MLAVNTLVRFVHLFIAQSIPPAWRIAVDLLNNEVFRPLKEVV